MDFLWHKVSEKEKKSIKKQAKKIMDDFSKKLSKVSKVSDVSELEERFIEREECDREESEKKKSCEMDRKIMFGNAPKSNNDFIIAEKKKW
ncbi:hypothetical protein GF378_02715 [Candidatus Pacearchaeota archaeon]|nr:hypothetical protein [Candidatus Pacearchaeota archaeon]